MQRMGILLVINKILILWRVIKQTCIAILSMEAEFIAVTETAKNTKCVYSTLKFLVQSVKLNNIINLPKPILFCDKFLVQSVKLNNIINLPKPILFCDNSAAIQFTKFKAGNVRTRYIDIKYKFVHELYNNGWFDILHISTKENVVDLLTKSLPKELFLKFRSHYLVNLQEQSIACVPHENDKETRQQKDNLNFSRHPNQVT